MFVGVIIIAITVVLYTQKPLEISDGYRDGLVFWFLLVRLTAIVTLISEAKRQNRTPSSWGLFAFIFPPIALMIISFTQRISDSTVNTTSSSKIGNEHKTNQDFQLPETPDISNLSNVNKEIYRNILRELKYLKKTTAFSFDDLDLLEDKEFLWKYSLSNPDCTTELFTESSMFEGHYSLKEKAK